MNKINWSTKSIKQLRKIPTAAHIVKKAGELSEFPECQHTKRLSNHKYTYRLRVGNYRVFFEFNGSIKIVTIEEVKKRDENTY